MFLNNSNLDNLLVQVKDMNVLENEVLVFLIGEHTEIDLDDLIRRLEPLNITFFGGVFTGLIDGPDNHTDGIILKKYPCLSPPCLVRGLESDQFEIPEIRSIITKNERSKATIFTIVDGLTSNIATYLDKLYQHVGTSAKVIGGGAGSLTLQQSPCVFNKDGVFQDAAIICLLDLEISLSVKHGWTKLIGPMIATKTNKNVIYELNWENAFTVYKDALDKDSGKDIQQDNFFSIAKGYPFGIIKDNGEDIVRDPISTGDNGELICVGEVPENTVLYILKGHQEELIQSAKSATEECLKGVTENIYDALIVDCISRTLFLEDEFSQELGAIETQMQNAGTATRAQGILSLGEIASSGEGVLEFYNKTLVVGALFN